MLSLLGLKKSEAGARWLGDEPGRPSTGKESWRVAGARLTAEQPGLIRPEERVECAIRDAEHGLEVLVALEQFAAGRVASKAPAEWSAHAAGLGAAAGAGGCRAGRRWPLGAGEQGALAQPCARDGLGRGVDALAAYCAAAGGDGAGDGYASLKKLLRGDVGEAGVALAESHGLLVAARQAAAASEQAVAARRAAVAKASDGLDAARRHADVARRNAVKTSGRAQREFAAGGSSAPAAGTTADRASFAERKSGERALEAEARLNHERRELRCAADAAVACIAERERAETVVSTALRSLRRDLAGPRALAALRAAAAAERASLDARRRRLDDLDAALALADGELFDDERGATPERRAATKVSRALGLLRDAEKRRETDPRQSPNSAAEVLARDQDVDARIFALFLEGDEPLEDEATADAVEVEVGTPASKGGSPRRLTASDVIAEAAGAAGFEADHARRLVAGMFFGGDKSPPEPASPAAAAEDGSRAFELRARELATTEAPDVLAAKLEDFVKHGGERKGGLVARGTGGSHGAGARAAAVVRALNRQRSRRTEAPSPEKLAAVAAVARTCLDASLAARDARSPAVLGMLAQTFYRLGDDPESPATPAEGAPKKRDSLRVAGRDARVYLKDALKDHETWRSAAFWDQSMAEAALDAVNATSRDGVTYDDLVFTAQAPDAAKRVHLVVHAQLAAFCLSMSDLGADRVAVQRFARRTAAQYQLPAEDLASILGAYADEPDPETPASTPGGDGAASTPPS